MRAIDAVLLIDKTVPAKRSEYLRDRARGPAERARQFAYRRASGRRHEQSRGYFQAALANRLERQRCILGRDNPPKVTFLVDELALYRCVGSAEVMADQLRRLRDTAALPLVTLQVLPAVAHNANASGFIVADDATAYAEHVAGGYVFTDEQTVTSLAIRFDSLRGECMKVSESAALLERMAEQWATGTSPLTQTPTAGRA